MAAKEAVATAGHEILNRFFDLFESLVDNDTLIIVTLGILAYENPEHLEFLAGGLIGFLGGRLKKQAPK